MSRRRPARAAFVRTAALLLAVAARTVLAVEPFVPADEAVVLEKLRRPMAAGASVPSMRPDAQALRDPGRALAFAFGQLRALRLDGDPRRAGAARAALKPWYQHPHPAVRLALGMLAQYEHDFAGARALLDAVPPDAPEFAQARLVAAAVRQAQGDYAGAAADCRRLPTAAARYARACLAELASLTGTPPARAAARRELGDLAGAARRDGLDWQWLAVAEAEAALRDGDTSAAESRLRAVVAGGAADVYARAVFADLLLDAGRPREVVQWLQDDHDADALLLRFAIAARRAGDVRASSVASQLGARLAAARLRGDRLHAREEARYALELQGDADTALSFALENWRQQKEPADARLVLAAARVAGRERDADAVRAFLADRGVHDVRLSAFLP